MLSLTVSFTVRLPVLAAFLPVDDFNFLEAFNFKCLFGWCGDPNLFSHLDVDTARNRVVVR